MEEDLNHVKTFPAGEVEEGNRVFAFNLSGTRQRGDNM